MKKTLILLFVLAILTIRPAVKQEPKAFAVEPAQEPVLKANVYQEEVYTTNNTVIPVATISLTKLDKEETIATEITTLNSKTEIPAGIDDKTHILIRLKEMYEDYESMEKLIEVESGFNRYAKNPVSGACGIPQALPCSKMMCSLSDIDCQLDWQKDYILERYGSPRIALDFWLKNNYY